MKSVYIAGPMRSNAIHTYERYNFDAFLRAEVRLRNLEPTWTIYNPARDELEAGFDPTSEVDEKYVQEMMRRNVTEIAASDYIILLPGWEYSRGVRKELTVAKACGVEPYFYDTLSRIAPLGTTDWDELADICLDADEELAKWDQEPAGESVLWKPIADWFVATEPESLEDALDGSTMDGNTDEIRMTSSTGGQKGAKPEDYSLLPWEALEEVARVYHFGAQKYDRDNWRKGYEWSLSFAALMRHIKAFWLGESYNPESGQHHLAHAAFHLFTLMVFDDDHGTYIEHDDRPVYSKPKETF